MNKAVLYSGNSTIDRANFYPFKKPDKSDIMQLKNCSPLQIVYLHLKILVSKK